MTVYLDVVLLENLCMNYIILFATGYIIKLKIKHLRIIISAFIGSIYAVLAYMQILPIYSNIIMKVILSIVMVYVAYNSKNIKLMLKQLLMFYLTSFVFGGCAFALLYFIKPQDILMRNGVYVGTYPIKIALLGGIVGFVTTYLAFKIIKNKLTSKDVIYQIKITLKEKVLNINAMLDTGNMLKDPITGIPVIVVEKEKLEEILPKDILDNIDKIMGGEGEKTIKDLESLEYISKFRIIPYNSVGKQNGLMLGFKADNVSILVDDEEKVINNVIIGIFNHLFTKTGNYSALIGLDILERSEKNEYITNVKI